MTTDRTKDDPPHHSLSSLSLSNPYAWNLHNQFSPNYWLVYDSPLYFPLTTYLLTSVFFLNLSLLPYFPNPPTCRTTSCLTNPSLHCWHVPLWPETGQTPGASGTASLTLPAWFLCDHNSISTSQPLHPNPFWNVGYEIKWNISCS